MISRRQIRIRVMQAVYAWYCTEYHPADSFEYNLREFADEIREFERQKGDKGDSRLLHELFYQTIERRHEFDDMIQLKAENWELERIALIDRILMQMGICEMLNFEEIPIKVTINEYLEIAKKFSTPKSSKFINGILDSLFLDFKHNGMIRKRGRGLIEETLPKGGQRNPRPRRPDGPPPKRFSTDAPPPPRLRTDGPPSELIPRTGPRKRIAKDNVDKPPGLTIKRNNPNPEEENPPVDPVADGLESVIDQVPANETAPETPVEAIADPTIEVKDASPVDSSEDTAAPAPSTESAMEAESHPPAEKDGKAAKGEDLKEEE